MLAAVPDVEAGPATSLATYGPTMIPTKVQQVDSAEKESAFAHSGNHRSTAHMPNADRGTKGAFSVVVAKDVIGNVSNDTDQSARTASWLLSDIYPYQQPNKNIANSMPNDRQAISRSGPDVRNRWRNHDL